MSFQEPNNESHQPEKPQGDTTTAPVAERKPHTLTAHGKERIDDWFWLSEKSNPRVIELLEAENAYTEAVTTSQDELRTTLFNEIKGRVQETDLSVPIKRGPWWYYTRSVEGLQYPIRCRTQADRGVPTDSAPEQVLIDENKLAGDSEYFALGAFDVSPDGRRLAYSTDHQGDEVYAMHILDLETNELIGTPIERTSYGTAWSSEGDALFFMRQNESMRPYQVWRHVVDESAEDTCVFQEDDERFFVSVGNSKSEDFVSILVSSSITSEQHLLRASDPFGTFKVIEPRRHNVEYHAFHHRNESGERLFILTNEDAPNFKLMETSVEKTSRDNWKEIVGHRDNVKLDGVDPFKNFLVLAERAQASETMALLHLDGHRLEVVEQSEESYTAFATGNVELDTDIVRFNYSSMITPSTVFELNVSTGDRTLLKQQPVLGGFNADDYDTKRLWATAEDGTQVPMSLVYRKDRKQGAGPALLYGYGSYEISIDPSFSSARVSLLDRGFVFAIAHIRGGGDMGRLWYEHGKFLEKKNTFTDFIACANKLIEDGYTTSQQLAIRGGSAGGLLMGAVTNAAPQLFGAVVAEVPFVDSLTTMSDPTLPLTVHEYEEWGNPEDPEYYDYMASYSPYDNVTNASYPAMLVTAGLNDPRVSYWEPTKWVQKLRAHNTSTHPILLKTELGAGHGGPSGRYDAWRDEAFVQAFIISATSAT